MEEGESNHPEGSKEENKEHQEESGPKKYTRRKILGGILGAGAAALTGKELFGSSTSASNNDADKSTQPNSQTDQQTQASEGKHTVTVPGIASNAEGNTEDEPEPTPEPTPEPDGNNRLETIEGFPYSRSEVLFGENAGFEKARNGETLTVSFKEYASHMTKEEIEEVLDRWNEFTFSLGRKTALFRVADENEDADIRITPGDVTYVVNYSNDEIDYENNYDTSIINMESYSSKKQRQHVLTHELVHSLGIVDAIPDNLSEEQMESYVNPIILPENKEKNLQSIIDWFDWTKRKTVWFTEHDKNILRLAGYIPRE